MPGQLGVCTAKDSYCSFSKQHEYMRKPYSEQLTTAGKGLGAWVLGQTE